MENIIKEVKISEENLTKRELNVFIWAEFLDGEEEDLTDEEKKAWEVKK